MSININNRFFNGQNLAVKNNRVYIDGEDVTDQVNESNDGNTVSLSNVGVGVSGFSCFQTPSLVFNCSVTGSINSISGSINSIEVNGNVDNIEAKNSQIHVNTISGSAQTTNAQIVVNGDVGGNVTTTNSSIKVSGNVQGSTRTTNGNIYTNQK
jgi:hypothetical protein